MVEFDDKLEHLSEQDIAFMEAGGAVRSVGVRIYDGAHPASLAPRKNPRRRLTTGNIPANAEQAWVYVATDAAGRVKVGITSNPERRQAALASELRLLLPTAPKAAKHIETAAFQLLGHDLAHGEWVSAGVAAAMAAVWRAYTGAAMLMPVVPGLSEKDARALRIELAAQ